MSFEYFDNARITPADMRLIHPIRVYTNVSTCSPSSWNAFDTTAGCWVPSANRATAEKNPVSAFVNRSAGSTRGFSGSCVSVGSTTQLRPSKTDCTGMSLSLIFMVSSAGDVPRGTPAGPQASDYRLQDP